MLPIPLSARRCIVVMDTQQQPVPPVRMLIVEARPQTKNGCESRWLRNSLGLTYCAQVATGRGQATRSCPHNDEVRRRFQEPPKRKDMLPRAGSEAGWAQRRSSRAMKLCSESCRSLTRAYFHRGGGDARDASMQSKSS